MSILVHCSWLPGYIYVTQTILIILTMAGLFLDRLLVFSALLHLANPTHPSRPRKQVVFFSLPFLSSSFHLLSLPLCVALPSLCSLVPLLYVHCVVTGSLSSLKTVSSPHSVQNFSFRVLKLRRKKNLMDYWPVLMLMVLKSGIHSWPKQDPGAGIGCIYHLSKGNSQWRVQRQARPRTHVCYCISSYKLISPWGQASRFYS